MSEKKFPFGVKCNNLFRMCAQRPRCFLIGPREGRSLGLYPSKKVWRVLERLADHPLVNLGHIGQVMLEEKKKSFLYTTSFFFYI
jgi:hypothetical protein